jgi:hypothetical protein
MAEPRETVLLIHSPFVGPYTWRPVADRLERSGFSVLLPSLLPALEAVDDWNEVMSRCVAGALHENDPSGRLHLIVHSAAGFFLPVFRCAIQHPVASIVFVDARLPGSRSNLLEDSPPAFAELLGRLAQGGWLPPWSEWFGENVLKTLIADRPVRERFIGELRPIPSGLLTARVGDCDDWPDIPCAYLRLSNSYRAEAESARRKGWGVIEIERNHLHMLVDPAEIAELILNLIAEVTI